MTRPPFRTGRRGLLGLVGGAAVGALAGCSGRLGGGGSTPEDSSGSTETPRPETATDATRRPRVYVDSARLRDTRLTPTLVGFEPNTEVRLVATATDALGRPWSSEVTVRTDDDGAVSLADQAPVSGTYEGRRPMGFVWSMRMESVQQPSAFVTGPRERGSTVQLSAHVDGRERAHTTFRRRYVEPAVKHRRLRTRGLVGQYYEPATDGPHPGVIAIHGADNRPLRNYGRMLASYGFATLALKWFGGERPLADRPARVPVEYAQRAVTWLESKETVRSDEIGLLGHSKGAEYALLAASRDDTVGSVVAIAPTAYVFESPDRDVSASSWTVNGEPHPTVPRPDEPLPPERKRERTVGVETVQYAIEQADDEALANARIPVEDVSGDVLLVAGGRDGIWPSARMAETMLRRLERAGNDYRRDALIYPNAGHVITIPYKPTTYGMLGKSFYLGGTPSAIAAAEADAWPRTVSWFRNAFES